MLINNLELAEKIVKNTPGLSWDGWNIVWTKQDPSGYSHKNGMFKDDRWFIRQVFPLNNGGWDLPNKIVGT
jgi:hypothetical protein